MEKNIYTWTSNNQYWLTHDEYTYQIPEINWQVDIILCEKFPDFCSNPKLFKNRKEKYEERTKYIESTLSILNNEKTKEDFETIIKLLCTYKEISITKEQLDNVLSNLLNWDFSFLIYILESKEEELIMSKNTNEHKLVEKRMIIASEYKQILEIIFPLLSTLSHNNQIKNEFWDFIKKIDTITEKTLEFIEKNNFECKKCINCENCKFETLNELLYEIIDQALFLWAYFWHNVDYSKIFEISKEQFEIKLIKEEINTYFNKELETINEAIKVFKEKKSSQNIEKLKLLESIEPVLKAKMVLDKFLIYDLVELNIEDPKIWTLSKNDSFKLSKKQELEKKEAFNTLINHYNILSWTKCNTTREILEDFSKYLDNFDNKKIDLLINIVYDIIFYDNTCYENDDLPLKQWLDVKLLKFYKKNNLNFSLQKQIENISSVVSYKDHYKTNILKKFIRYYYKLSDIALLDPLTWLYNRRALSEHILDKIISDFRRDWINYSLISIDLDNFKKLNDTLWHDKWDEALIKFCDIIKENLRLNSYQIRLWWDEFLLLTKLDDIDWLIALSERIKREIKDWLQDYWITASIWIKILSDKFANRKINVEKLKKYFIDTELIILDELVYKSKENWRNTVSIYDWE